MFSPYVIAILVSWIVAQGFKVALASAGRREAFHKKMLYSSGSMPSAHSAATVALATTIGMRDGWDSAVFGIAFLFAGIVMYDAIMVRRSSGEQGSAIGSIIKEIKSKILPPRTAKGHEPVEVLVGAIIGVVVGILVFTFTK